MATYPSGLTRTFPEPDDFPTAAAWGVQLELALEEQPLGPSAACMNPECANPVDYAPSGTTLIYCSSYCRNRASDIRRRITHQLRVIDAALGPDHARARGLPRAALQARAHHLHWSRRDSVWVGRSGTIGLALTTPGGASYGRPDLA
ncbi:hypothetical protein O9K63_09110 [Janibacter cremeus]|uniref:hypothetical protein n=1 Tax=Janibacter cremeus TaxID=1285192 RepID=UPI0023F8156F|nr:hypothetical protein [Janibacter cremeus]WEV76765.1 hypothetical protein O9K63_09110 [Janibacter cremeus]